MKLFLLTVEFFIAITLIVSILLHSAKGEGMAAIGGNARLFSSQKGMEAGLNKFTWVMAILFMSIALLLSTLFK